MKRWEDERAELLAHLEDSFRNGDFSMFVRIGNRVINLASVTEIEAPVRFDNRTCALIRFDADNYTRIYSSEEGYTDLLEWIERQPIIKLAD